MCLIDLVIYDRGLVNPSVRDLMTACAVYDNRVLTNLVYDGPYGDGCQRLTSLRLFGQHVGILFCVICVMIMPTRWSSPCDRALMMSIRLFLSIYGLGVMCCALAIISFVRCHWQSKRWP